MQHFVIDEIFDSASRYIGAIEDAADYDCVVRWIIVSQALSRRVMAPGHQRTGQKSVKKTGVEIFKYPLQVVMTALCRQQQFSSTLLPQEMGLP